eukprot:CAMPEP_0174985962 /NCGR_PEP_ID=MMETSP0004_2-20121128/18654_1 /TAXON_ID=420556 /ORGANISM="Ochromonas sp., Strain CCMP1393" /LENGTH=93 /DNA_ID=CAMNT_0016238711 /DNA_START=530 /DNA_END=811 /DNA_ORIENTATION=+
MDLTRELGCGYSVDQAEWNPAAKYHLLTRGCELANGIGMVVIASALLTAYALYRFNTTTSNNNDTSSSSEGNRIDEDGVEVKNVMRDDEFTSA